MTVNWRHPLALSTNQPMWAEQFGGFPLSAFHEVLDRSDFRLKEFKMAATGKRFTCI